MMIARVPASKGSRWEAKKAKIRSKFPTITEAELNFDETREIEMLSHLQVKTNRTVRELQIIMESL